MLSKVYRKLSDTSPPAFHASGSRAQACMGVVTAVAVQWKVGRNPEMDELHAE